jgi:hypothetical protein
MCILKCRVQSTVYIFNQEDVGCKADRACVKCRIFSLYGSSPTHFEVRT